MMDRFEPTDAAPTPEMRIMSPMPKKDEVTLSIVLTWDKHTDEYETGNAGRHRLRNTRIDTGGGGTNYSSLDRRSPKMYQKLLGF